VLGREFNSWGMETCRGAVPPFRRFVCVDANHEVGPRWLPCVRDKKRGAAECSRAASANPLAGRRLVSRLGRCILTARAALCAQQKARGRCVLAGSERESHGWKTARAQAREVHYAAISAQFHIYLLASRIPPQLNKKNGKRKRRRERERTEAESDTERERENPIRETERERTRQRICVCLCVYRGECVCSKKIM
jgi:hypothetical protein